MSNECGRIFRLKSKKSPGSLKKRSKSNNTFSSMSVSHVEDDDLAGPGPGPGELYHDEKTFPNGDYYIGHWLDSLPHGQGKYVWNDGCVYAGEWHRGTTMGKARFVWPSGATYEGDFKNGYMDGKGSYTGSNSDNYRGYWVMNYKHGQGTIIFANGDTYEGKWKRGLQEGFGKYQWKIGHNFVGYWKHGIMEGTGTITWANGNKFEGNWLDGLPKGDGTYKWIDGSYYIGSWSLDPNEQTGTYYPVMGSSVPGNIEWEPQHVYKLEMEECKVCTIEKITMFPSQKPVGFDDLLHKHSMGRSSERRSVDGRLSNGSNMSNYSWDRFSDSAANWRRNSTDAFGRVMLETPRDVHPILLPKTIKKQGETISKGHKNYELMLNLQLGIRHSVGRPGPAINLDLKSSAFDPKEKVWTRFPTEGSKSTPPHPSCEFKWKDYCPLVFRTLRKLFKVDPADYMLSICGNDALRELSSPGKSGSFFYLTHDDKYMIKTVKKAEVKVLLRMLPAYYNHVRTFEDTLVTRFFGLHCVRLTGAQKKVRFVIMGNLFCTEHSIHRRFDLKGSSHGRTTEKPESEIDPTTTLKDLDLNYIFRLQRFWFQEFCRQVDRDCDFLEQERIMDYSLLVGLHFRDSCVRPVTQVDGKELIAPQLSKVDETDKLVFDPAQWASIRLGINMPARAEVTVRRTDCDAQLVGEPTGECYDVIIFFGIIDILQDYDISKKLEHAYKSFQYDPTSISAVDPKQYSKRFRDFIFKVFADVS